MIGLGSDKNMVEDLVAFETVTQQKQQRAEFMFFQHPFVDVDAYHLVWILYCYQHFVLLVGGGWRSALAMQPNGQWS